MDIIKVVITGGPCAGKTTSLTQIVDSLSEKGYTVFSVPEAASLIFNSGSSINLSLLSEK